MLGAYAARIPDRLKHERGLPKMIRSDKVSEFCGKPNENDCVESFNGSLRDECLNAHWFTSMTHARALIET